MPDEPIGPCAGRPFSEIERPPAGAAKTLDELVTALVTRKPFPWRAVESFLWEVRAADGSIVTTELFSREEAELICLAVNLLAETHGGGGS